MDIEVDHLISLVKERPLLWDKSLEEYKYKNLSLKAWEEICGILNENYETMDKTYKKSYGNVIIKKWKNIKDCWMKNNKKVGAEKRTGSKVKKTKKYIYNDQLQFLKKTIPIDNNPTSFKNSATTQQMEEQELSNNLTNESATITDAASTLCALSTPVFSQTSVKKKKKDDADKALIKMLSQREDRHLSFFRGILPSLQNFDESKTRAFQIAVLQIIDNLDNNFPAFPSNQDQQYCYNQENNSYNYSGYHTASNLRNYESPKNRPSRSTSVNTNMSDDVYFE